MRSPDAWLQSKPSSRREIKAWQTGGVHAWYIGMKAHIGADAESGLVHTVRGTSGHVSDNAEANRLLHGNESIAFGDAGYQGIEKRPDAKADVILYVAMIDQAKKLKAGIRAKVEHPFRVIKRQFGFVKVRYRGLKKNTAQLVTRSNLWMVRSKLMGVGA